MLITGPTGGMTAYSPKLCPHAPNPQNLSSTFLLRPSLTMTSVVAPPIKLSITASHDGGNIQLVSQTEPIISGRTAKCTVKLNIKPDVYTDFEKIAHMQYFSIRSFVSGLEDIKIFNVTYVIDNADKVSYPEAWPGTTICETVSSCLHNLINDVMHTRTPLKTIVNIPRFLSRVAALSHQMTTCGREI